MNPHLAEDLRVQIDAVLGAPKRVRTFHIWGAAMQVVQSDALVRAPLVIERMHRRERRGTPALVRPRLAHALCRPERQSEAIRGNQRQSEAIRGNQRRGPRLAHALCRPERQSEAIRGNQRQSEERSTTRTRSLPSGEALCRHKRSSEAIRGPHQSSSKSSSSPADRRGTVPSPSSY